VILEIGRRRPSCRSASRSRRALITPVTGNPGFVLEVRRTARAPQISLSRTHPGYLARLFQTEIPEIQEGIVLVKATAREAGEPRRVAVASTNATSTRSAPVSACAARVSRSSAGSCAARRSTSSSGPTIRDFVARAALAGQGSSVAINEITEGEGQPAAVVIVPDNQLSLAIERKAQNARLAAKLTGMRIDIKSESEVETERSPAKAPPAEIAPRLAALPALGPELVDALVLRGSFTRAIVKAGHEKLSRVAEIGDRNGHDLLGCREICAARLG